MPRPLPLTALAFAALGVLTATAAAQNRSYLNIGDPAPALRPAAWVKGSPVPAFEKGKVYVVEFWATWCTPCKANIPHLTELAKRFAGKASVIGVDVWESNDPSLNPLPKVRAFVKSEGAKMVYHVAADGTDNRVANAWMKRAGEGGLPMTFVIGRDRRVAWIGDPTRLADVLQAVVENRFDVAASRGHRAVETDVSRPINEARDAKQYGRLLALTDAAIAKKPESERLYVYDRLNALFHVDLTAAEKKAQAILDESHGEIGAYQMIASIFASNKDLSPDAYRYGRGVADEALLKKDREYLFRAMRAEIDASLGERDMAVEDQKAAVAAGAIDSHCPPAFLDFLKKNLERFRAAAKGA